MEELIKRRDFFNGLGQNYPKNESVKTEAISINGVSCYWFLPENEIRRRIIIYLHGGVFVVGSIQSHQSMVSHFSARLQTRILFIDYALAPENPFPHGLNDVLDVYQKLIADFPHHEIIFMGDSAGAGLTVSAIGNLSEANIQLPCGVVMISPWINLSCENDSLEENRALDPILTREYLKENVRMYTGGTPVTISSPEYINFNYFPPLLILVGTDEILLDDSKIFYSRIKPIQPNSTLSIYENQKHVWPLANIHSAPSQKAIAEIETFLKTLIKI